jgi:hypothetical protein
MLISLLSPYSRCRAVTATSSPSTFRIQKKPAAPPLQRLQRCVYEETLPDSAMRNSTVPSGRN